MTATTVRPAEPSRLQPAGRPGDRPFVAALVTLDSEATDQWARDHGVAIHTISGLGAHAEVRATIQAAVDDANRSVSLRAESIRRFEILPDGITIESGELTPTLKVRHNVETRHATVIEDLYAPRPDADTADAPPVHATNR